jgi:pimeloyl-ACP methyl ester carboxylesterase
MTQSKVLCAGPGGFHRIAYADWGAPGNATVLCVHGLTRNGRDFDRLAGALEDRFRVVCPDIAGRGRSDWLIDPAGYVNPHYVADMVTLLARLGAETLDWVGTSMGGIMGMLAAAMPGTPVRRLVLNDVGPFIPKAALARIGNYVGADPRFDDVAGVESYLRKVHASFGDLTDENWRHMAAHGARRREDGSYGLAYDPAIGNAFKGATLPDVDLWVFWDAIQCPVLVLRGADSDLLLAETADEMTRRGPKATLVEVEGCGHAPALMAADQIAAVRDWLTG